MKVAIIGAGFTGLAAAYKLSKRGIAVIVFEKEATPGGLAIGFKEKDWEWALERHYHHLFTSDNDILQLAAEVGHKINFSKAKSSTQIHSKILQLDSPFNLIKFPEIPFIDRIRTGIVLTYLKLTPLWLPLETITAKQFLIKWMGNKSWQTLWQPLFSGKFHGYQDQIPASWFWARVKKRSAKLGYPEGGFLALAKSVENLAKKNRVKFVYNTSVKEIAKNKKGLEIKTKNKTYLFDKVICTLPTPMFLGITKKLPQEYTGSIKPLKGLGALNLVLCLSKQLLTDSSYWLNINDKHPFLAIVEHTNFINKSHYGDNHLIYIGNYLPQDHEYFSKSAEELTNIFLPHLRQINPNFSGDQIRQSWVFKAPFAQPIVPLNYSKLIPPLTTPIPGLFLANMQQVYPWDRGTNYAVELGLKVASEVADEAA